MIVNDDKIMVNDGNKWWKSPRKPTLQVFTSKGKPIKQVQRLFCLGQISTENIPCETGTKSRITGAKNVFAAKETVLTLTKMNIELHEKSYHCTHLLHRGMLFWRMNNNQERLKDVGRFWNVNWAFGIRRCKEWAWKIEIKWTAKEDAMSELERYRWNEQIL